MLFTSALLKTDASGYLTNIPSMGNDGKPNTKIIYGRRRYIKIIYRRWGMMGTEYNTVFGHSSFSQSHSENFA